MIRTNRLTPKGSMLGMALLAATACGDSTGVEGPQNVSLNFRVSGLPSQAVATTPLGPNLVAGPPLALEGTNGTLTLEEIRIIINEVKLKPADGRCDVVESSGGDCPDFEAPPRFLDLPLDGNPISAVTALISAGDYKRLDFEVEDLEDDETDPVQAAAIAALRAEILAIVPDWPRKASMLLVGTFQPTGGTPIDFRVFAEAEIEVRFDLVPNLRVGADGTASRSLTVDIRPDIWFKNADGSILALHLWDYALTGQLLEFEVEMRDGFTEIEIDG